MDDSHESQAEHKTTMWLKWTIRKRRTFGSARSIGRRCAISTSCRPSRGSNPAGARPRLAPPTCDESTVLGIGDVRQLASAPIGRAGTRRALRTAPSSIQTLACAPAIDTPVQTLGASRSLISTSGILRPTHLSARRSVPPWALPSSSGHVGAEHDHTLDLGHRVADDSNDVAGGHERRRIHQQADGDVNAISEPALLVQDVERGRVGVRRPPTYPEVRVGTNVNGEDLGERRGE